MKTLFTALFLLCVAVSARAQFSPAQLDSLRRVAASTNTEIKNRINATVRLGGYFSLVPIIDSAVLYSERAKQLLPLAPDSLTYYNLLYASQDIVGKAFLNKKENQSALEYFFQAEKNIYHIDKFSISTVEQKSAFSKHMVTQLSIAICYKRMLKYALADSMYNDIIHASMERQDTLQWAGGLMNLASSQYLQVHEARKEEVSKELWRLALGDSLLAEALRLERAYLAIHPNDVSMARYLINTLNNQAGRIEIGEKIKGEENLNPEQIEQTQALMLESLRLARQIGIPGKDLMTAQMGVIRLILQLKRAEGGLKQADSFIQDAVRNGMPAMEAAGYGLKADAYMLLKDWPNAITSLRMAILKYETDSYLSAALCAESAADQLESLPPLQRRKYKKDIAAFRQQAEAYRAKAAIQEASGQTPQGQ